MKDKAVYDEKLRDSSGNLLTKSRLDLILDSLKFHPYLASWSCISPHAHV